MARVESDREDLIREATALVDRMELQVDGLSQLVTAGFRKNGSLSLFFGQDPVYQFDSTGRLRRAYRDGRLYRSQRDTLAKLTRQRTPERTMLLRDELTPEELAEFRSTMMETLSLLARALTAGKVVVLRSAVVSSDAISQVKTAIDQVLDSGDAWLSAEIRGRH